MEGRADEEWAFQAYEAVRGRLPQATFPDHAKQVNTLADLADDVDVFLLDAFGVLNIGERAIPGAAARIRQLRGMGKRVLVVTNAAGYPKRLLMQRYERLGFDFTPDDVISSRDTLLAALADQPARHWGLIASQRFGVEELDHLDTEFMAEDPTAYDRAEGFLFIGAGEWTEARQALLTASLRARPRPVLVGNPDIVSPGDKGLNREPGHYAHRLADETGVTPQFYGKPFSGIFDLALARLDPDQDLSRLVMVGDTLQTDILGGRAAGLKTALLTGYGALRGLDINKAIQSAGIVPHYHMPEP